MLARFTCSVAPVFSIRCYAIGLLQTNCYLLSSHGHTLIVDPAARPELILDLVKRAPPGSQTDIFLTHGHADHIAAVPALCEALHSARIFASKHDLDYFTDADLNLSLTHFNELVTLKRYFDCIIWVDNGQTVEIGGADLKIVGLPGHTAGSIGLLNPAEKWIVVGARLLNGDIGMSDAHAGITGR